MSEKIEELRRIRIQKLEQLRKSGFDPYPVSSKRTQDISSALANFSELSKHKKKITLAGRLRSIRKHGKLIFATLEDLSGSVQLLIREDVLGEKPFEHFGLFDMGDILEASGIMALSKTKEQSLEVENYSLLAKSIRPVPQHFYGLKDTETRLRKRYLDLMTNPEVREMFIKKSVFWSTIRKFMVEQGFLEVQTPVLESISGGADA